MAKPLFKMDDRELKKWIKFHKQAPKLIKRAVAGTLNTFAFETRKKSLHIIMTNMTVRARKFVEGSMRVDKAKAGQSINQQHSVVGSIKRPRFTGWEEQETGKKAKRNRVATALARGGNMSGKVKPSARLKRANTFVSPDDYPGKNKNHRVIVMLQVLFRKRWKKPFLVKGSKKFKKGIYRIQAGKRLRMLQNLEPSSTQKQPKRVRWMTGGLKAFKRGADIGKIWEKNVKRVLKIK